MGCKLRVALTKLNTSPRGWCHVAELEQQTRLAQEAVQEVSARHQASQSKPLEQHSLATTSSGCSAGPGLDVTALVDHTEEGGMEAAEAAPL